MRSAALGLFSARCIPVVLATEMKYTRESITCGRSESMTTASKTWRHWVIVNGQLLLPYGLIVAQCDRRHC
jgi:hypothetical protein